MVRFHDRVLTNSPNISADVTSIDMSHYFPSHPQYYLTYNITVQALHGDEMVVANVSKHVIASKFNIIRRIYCKSNSNKIYL